MPSPQLESQDSVSRYPARYARSTMGSWSRKTWDGKERKEIRVSRCTWSLFLVPSLRRYWSISCPAVCRHKPQSPFLGVGTLLVGACRGVGLNLEHETENGLPLTGVSLPWISYLRLS